MTARPPESAVPDPVPASAQGQPSTRGEKAGFLVSPPAISLPKGGGAIRGIGEKFTANPATGTGSLTVPLPVSAGRGGFQPALALHYDSGAGNGVFGIGWSLSLPSIARKTDKGLPRYLDADESDDALDRIAAVVHRGAYVLDHDRPAGPAHRHRSTR